MDIPSSLDFPLVMRFTNNSRIAESLMPRSEYFLPPPRGSFHVAVLIDYTDALSAYANPIDLVPLDRAQTPPRKI